MTSLQPVPYLDVAHRQRPYVWRRAQAQLEQAMTAAPGHVNELVEQIMERLHSAALEGHSGEDSPTLTEVLHVSGFHAQNWGVGVAMCLDLCQAHSTGDPPLRRLRSIKKWLPPSLSESLQFSWRKV